MTNLGEQLAQSKERETRAAEAALAHMPTADGRQALEVGQTFFNQAREFFIKGIREKIAVKDLYVQVGGSSHADGRDGHIDFAQLLKGYVGPGSRCNPRRFRVLLEALWSQFQVWAKSEGLQANLHRVDDGSGTDFWWELRIQPLPKLGR
jgi:hypothetical protein